ncbi:MAG: hypothetical protein DRR42_01520 [Gammaproteobacteria bacterium]|nr:MAG: hypothetical protein DRR42_01520 [Gammaproteobacteria bacterium]
MNEFELIPTGFGLCWIAYYLRGILRIHRSRTSGERTTTFWQTWLRFWLSPAILKDSFRCALISLGVFLGIEIARGDNAEDEVDEDSEIDHF